MANNIQMFFLDLKLVLATWLILNASAPLEHTQVPRNKSENKLEKKRNKISKQPNCQLSADKKEQEAVHFESRAQQLEK